MANSYKFGLLGHNVSYSKSADIFNAIFDIKSINGSFENFDLSLDNFESEFKEIIEKHIDGFSVTIPFKNRIIPLLSEVSPIATALDAVNSVAVTNELLNGYNTDTVGFSMPLAKHAEQLKNGSALIFGSGGSARAVMYTLYTDYEISKFTVVGRTESNLKYCRNSMQKILLNTSIEICSFKEFFPDINNNISIVVNCTPLGGWNQPDESPMPKEFKWSNAKLYYDLNYNDNNKVIGSARDSGLVVYDGSRMLVGQAVRSFEIWTGESADFSQIYNRVFKNTVQESHRS